MPLALSPELVGTLSKEKLPVAETVLKMPVSNNPSLTVKSAFLGTSSLKDLSQHDVSAIHKGGAYKARNRNQSMPPPAEDGGVREVQDSI